MIRLTRINRIPLVLNFILRTARPHNRIELASNVPSGTNTVFIRALQGTDTNWALRTCVAGPTCPAVATTTPIVTNEFAFLSVKPMAAGTIVATATQNGVTSTASCSNIPSVAVVPCMIAINGGATTVELDVDLFACKVAGLVRY